MKKNTLSIAALVIALCALILALFAGVTAGRLQSQVDELTRLNADLAAQVQEMSARQNSFFVTSGAAGISGWADSSGGYSSLMVESWSYTPGNLTITGGYANVQLPEIAAASAPDSAVTLKYNGEVLHSQALELTPDETGAAFEAELQGLTFDLPELAGDDPLELWLDVTIDGETQSVIGAEWYLENGQLLMVAG